MVACVCGADGRSGKKAVNGRGSQNRDPRYKQDPVSLVNLGARVEAGYTHPQESRGLCSPCAHG